MRSWRGASDPDIRSGAVGTVNPNVFHRNDGPGCDILLHEREDDGQAGVHGLDA